MNLRVRIVTALSAMASCLLEQIVRQEKGTHRGSSEIYSERGRRKYKTLDYIYSMINNPNLVIERHGPGRLLYGSSI